MKRSILLAFAALSLFSCSKSDNGSTPEPEASKSTILLTRVIETTGGSPSVRMEYTYNGKQMTRAGYGKLANGTYGYWYDFAYNTQGQLTGMTAFSNTITPTTKKADVTWTNGELTKIIFTKFDNTTRENTFTYASGRLTTDRAVFSASSIIDNKYTYDASGRNTKIEFKETTNAGSGIYEFTAFDDKKSIVSSLPNWTFFLAYSYDLEVFSDSYGANNPLSEKYTTTGYTYPSNETYTYSYTYNGYGYPATMTKKDGSGYTTSYAYEYTEVK